MNVLISWVGPSGRQVARALRDWLPEVVSAVEPDVIEEDVLSYSSMEWKQELAARVDASAACIVCITSEAARSPDLYFHLGLIMGVRVNGPLYTFFVRTDNEAPPSLGRYGLECVVAQKENVLSFVNDLNRRIGRPPLPELFLLGLFSAKWPALQDTLAAAKPDSAVQSTVVVVPPAHVQSTAMAKPDSAVQHPLLPSVLGTTLSDPALELLLEATTDPNGVVVPMSTFEGWHLQTNGKEFVEPKNPRSETKWRATLRELMKEGLLSRRSSSKTPIRPNLISASIRRNMPKERLLEPRGSKGGEIYVVTQKGRQFADMIRKARE